MWGGVEVEGSYRHKSPITKVSGNRPSKILTIQSNQNRAIKYHEQQRVGENKNLSVQKFEPESPNGKRFKQDSYNEMPSVNSEM